MNPTKKYWYDVIGFNFRMTNLQAALGVAQVKKVGEFIIKKRKLAQEYNKKLKNIKGITTPPEKSWAKNVYWMYSVLTDKNFIVDRDDLMKKLKSRGIESRPFFYPIHTMPMYKEKKHYKLAEKISERGVNLPSSVNLTSDDIKQITDRIKEL